MKDRSLEMMCGQEGQKNTSTQLKNASKGGGTQSDGTRRRKLKYLGRRSAESTLSEQRDMFARSLGLTLTGQQLMQGNYPEEF